MEIIPAIDIIEGKCVRLSQGDYNTKKEYSANPLAMAQKYEEIGLSHIHIVDLEGAKNGQPVNLKSLAQITNQTELFIDYGGGIKTEEDLQSVFEKGADQITAGSVAVKHRNRVEKWLERYGREKIILGADIKGEKIAVDGWQNQTEVNIFDFIDSYLEAGIQYVICTDISKDGMLEGPAVSLYTDLVDKYPDLDIIASGGVSAAEDLKKLKETGVKGTIVGKAIYEGKIDLETLVELSE